MNELWNKMKGAGVAVASQIGQNRWGTIESVKPSDSGYEAKILLQPEGILSGWLPVLSHSVGGGWGIVAPPEQGTQAFIASDTGDGHHGVIIGLSYSLATKPPVPANDFNQPDGTPVSSGEIAIVSKKGGLIRLCADGSIHIQGNLRIDGNVTIQGDVSVEKAQSGALGKISAADDIHSGNTITATSDILSGADVSDVHGKLDLFRSGYNRHTHVGGGFPNPQIPE